MRDEKKSKHWAVHRSRYVHRDQWVTLRADDCETPGGVAVSPFYVLEYPDWVFLTVFDGRENVLLVRLYRHGNRQVNLELPGGIVDASDSSPEEAARRELREETGYAADAFVHVGALTPNASTHSNLVHCFLVTGAEQVDEPRPAADEDIETELVPLARLLAMVDTGEFSQALHMAALFRVLRYRAMHGL